MSASRTYPFRPTSATQLRVGDVIAVTNGTGTWGALQVCELKPRTRTSLVVGVLDWMGNESPRSEDTKGLRLRAEGIALTTMKIFSDGDATVVGNHIVRQHSFGSFYGPARIGKTTQVWGWRTAVRRPFAGDHI